MRHKEGFDSQGYGAGTVPPMCPSDRRDGRCNVLMAGDCGVRHRTGPVRCAACWTYCVQHGMRWTDGEE